MTEKEQTPQTKESTLNNNIISKVQQLIDSGKGDARRLQHICDMISDNKPLYHSDQIYLKSLYETYFASRRNWANLTTSESPGVFYPDTSESPGLFYPDTSESPDVTYTSILRDITISDIAGIPLPYGEILRTGSAEYDESKIKSIVNQTLGENMPVFEKVISSIIDHKLSNLGLVPTTTINPTDIHLKDEEEILTAFAKLDFIKNISYSKHNSVIKLVVTHTESDNLKAFEQIEDTIIDLENKLPAYSIEPWILHESEVQDSFVSKTKLIFSK